MQKQSEESRFFGLKALSLFWIAGCRSCLPRRLPLPRLLSQRRGRTITNRHLGCKPRTIGLLLSSHFDRFAARHTREIARLSIRDKFCRGVRDDIRRLALRVFNDDRTAIHRLDSTADAIALRVPRLKRGLPFSRLRGWLTLAWLRG